MYNGFRDKIIQHSLCDNVLGPLLSKTFIYDNYASQKGKGTHFGLDRLKSFMQRYYRQFGADGWVLKCDISKYFYRINHDVLKSQLRRVIHDPDVLWLLDLIIDSTDGPGIPIGNHTSQWFAILYLSGMDHMIKERLGIKFYGRYMDDFYLIHPDKEYLLYCLEEIRKFLVPLGLELNHKTAVFPLSQGIDFLGFRTYMTDSGKAEIEEVPSPSGRRADHLRNCGPVLFFLGRPRRTRQQLPPDQEHGRTVLRPVQKRNGGISCQNNCRRFPSARS